MSGFTAKAPLAAMQADLQGMKTVELPPGDPLTVEDQLGHPCCTLTVDVPGDTHEAKVQNTIKVAERFGYPVERKELPNGDTVLLVSIPDELPNAQHGSSDPVAAHAEEMWEMLQWVAHHVPARLMPAPPRGTLRDLVQKIKHELADANGITPFSRVSVTREGKPIKDNHIRMDVALRYEHSGMLPEGYRLWHQGLEIEPCCIDFKL